MSAAEHNPGRLLKKAQLRYEEVCEQLDVLNNEAFELESEMLRLQWLIKKKSKKDGN